MNASEPNAVESESPGEGRARGRIRFALRSGVLVAAMIVVWPLASYTWVAMALVAASPFVALGSTIAARTVGWITLAALLIVVASLIRRRWFCRWLCPTGLLCEQLGRIGSAAGCRAPPLPPVGQWIAMITFAGAILGYPLLLWLDPLALLASFLGNRWDDPLTTASLLSAAGLSAVLAVSLIAPGVWCARICPLGATQDLLAEVARTVGRVPLLARCPPDVLSSENGPQAAGKQCHTARRDSWNRARPSGGESGWRLPRRVALAGGLGAAWAWTVQRSLAGQPRPIRPPGALEEDRFRGVCVRCGHCVRACPTGILHADLGEHGLSGLMCPAVRFGPGYCREDCCRCGEACPSGAIVRLLPADKPTSRMGLASVDHSLCLLSDNRECSVCKNCCPYGAIATVWSDEEYTMAVAIDPSRCPGCGACEVACPTSPKKAINIFAHDSRATNSSPLPPRERGRG